MTLLSVVERSLKDRGDLDVRFDYSGINPHRVKLSNGESYTIDFDDFDAEESDEFGDDPFAPYYSPTEVMDHVTLLDAVLHAISSSPYAGRIRGLTTDGDGKDCEAIFLLDGAPSILKIR